MCGVSCGDLRCKPALGPRNALVGVILCDLLLYIKNIHKYFYMTQAATLPYLVPHLHIVRQLRMRIFGYAFHFVILLFYFRIFFMLCFCK